MASRRALCSFLFVLGSLMLLGSASAGPLAPGTYTIKSASRQGSCTSFFLTAPTQCGSNRPEMMAIGAVGWTSARQWRFELVPGSTDKYYISNLYRRPLTGCTSYLSVQRCGGTSSVDLWRAAGSNQQFQLVPTGRTNEYWIKAVVRADAGCNAWMSVQGCGGSSFVDMWGANGGNQAFIVS